METPKIYTAISKVMEEVGAIGKNKKNIQGSGFMYRGIDDVMNALNPAMIKNKVFVAPEILEQIREERQTQKGGNLIYSILKIKYTFYTDDGSSVSASVIGEAFDSGDKATNKAMSIAFKYACFQVFCIPTEEMREPDAEHHEVISKEEAANIKKFEADQRAKDEAERKAYDEAQKIGVQKIPQVKVHTIEKKLDELGIGVQQILERYHVETLSDLTENLFVRVMNALNKTQTSVKGE